MGVKVFLHHIKPVALLIGAFLSLPFPRKASVRDQRESPQGLSFSSASASFVVTLHICTVLPPLQNGNTLQNPCSPPAAGLLTTTRRVATASYHAALARRRLHTRPPKCSPYIVAAPLQDYSQDALCLANRPCHSSHASSHHHHRLAYSTSPPNGPDSLQ